MWMEEKALGSFPVNHHNEHENTLKNQNGHVLLHLGQSLATSASN